MAGCGRAGCEWEATRHGRRRVWAWQAKGMGMPEGRRRLVLGGDRSEKKRERERG